jgi:hypothetical protein
MSTRVALSNARSFTSQATKVVEFGPPDPPSLDYIDMVNNCGVQGKDALHSDSEAGLTHRNRFSRTAVFACDANAFKRLQSLFGLRLLDSNVHANRVAGLEVRNILPQLGLFNTI